MLLAMRTRRTPGLQLAQHLKQRMAKYFQAPTWKMRPMA